MLEFQLIIPCYNEAKSLVELVRQVVTAADEANYSPDTFQLILVDNGSTDDTKAVISQLLSGPHSSWINIATVVKNQGVGNGLSAGLRKTTASFIGWIHADLQNDPRDVFTALSILKNANDPHKTFVKGVRKKRNFLNFLQSRIFDLTCLFILRFFIKELGALPKICHRDFLVHLESPPPHYGFDLYVMFCVHQKGWKVLSIPVRLHDRLHGNSHWATNLSARWKTFSFLVGYMRQLRTQHISHLNP